MSDDSSSSDSSDPYGQEVQQVPQFMRQRSPSPNSEPEQEESRGKMIGMAIVTIAK